MTTPLAPVVVIGCGKQKLDRRAVAADLYTGPLFRSRRDYARAAEGQGSRWFVLSAGRGLVLPSELIEPYDVTVDDLAHLDRAALFTRAASTLIDELDDVPAEASLREVRIEVHAGAAYSEPLCDVLRAVGFSAWNPVRHMGIGAQRGWYGKAIKRVVQGRSPHI